LRSDLKAKFPAVNFDYNHLNHGNIIFIPKEYVVAVLKHFKTSVGLIFSCK